MDETPGLILHHICIFNFLNYSQSDLLFSGRGPVFHGQCVRSFLFSLGNLGDVLGIHRVLAEVEGLVVLVAGAGSSVHHVGDTLALLFDTTAVDLHELIYSQEPTSNTDYDGLAL